MTSPVAHFRWQLQYLHIRTRVMRIESTYVTGGALSQDTLDREDDFPHSTDSGRWKQYINVCLVDRHWKVFSGQKAVEGTTWIQTAFPILRRSLKA
jgi:hypothetical protein